MRVIFKCEECESGPCYCYSPNYGSAGGMYEQREAWPPLVCPNFPHNETADWEPVQEYTVENSPFETLFEWIGGEGYEKAAPELRDAILAGWFDVTWYMLDGSYQAVELLDEITDRRHRVSWAEILENVKKVPKKALIAVSWARGFQAGLMMAEKIRVELKERAEKQSTVDD